MMEVSCLFAIGLQVFPSLPAVQVNQSGLLGFSKGFGIHVAEQDHLPGVVVLDHCGDDPVGTE
jgi:hypothetical protein